VPLHDPKRGGSVRGKIFGRNQPLKARDANSIVLRDECSRIAHRSGSCPASVFGWRLGTSQDLGCAALTRIELKHCSILRLV
jgi:hypothetical protein